MKASMEPARMTSEVLCTHCLQPLPQPVYRVGCVILDTNLHQVYVGKREVPLSAQEFRLLATLMRRPGMALSADTLAYQMESDSEDPLGLVTVYVSKLRRKLGRAVRIKAIYGEASYRVVP